MTGLPIKEIQSDESPSKSTSKDAEVPIPNEVNSVCSGDIQSVHEHVHLSDDIQTRVGGTNARNNENNIIGLSMEVKDKTTTETLVVSDEKSESDMMDAKNASCCLGTRVVKEDLKGNYDIPINEVDLKIIDEEQEQCRLDFKNLEEEKIKSIVALAAEALNIEVEEGKSSGDLKDIIVDNTIRKLQFATEEKPAEVKNQTFLCKEKKLELINKIKEDKAKQPIAVMITTRSSRRKPRGKPKSSEPSVNLKSQKSSRTRSTSVAAEKFGPLSTTRRKSTGSCDIGRRERSNRSYIIEHNLYIKSHSEEFRRRIKNVKSRLFKETKSFVTPSRKKPRGKPKSSEPSVALKSQKPSRNRSTPVAAEKFGPLTTTRRKSTGSCDMGRRERSNCSHIIEHNLYIKSHSTEFRRRIKNVKSRLFKETKSFVAYKSARHKEAQERRNRIEEIARKTKYLYADRTIDFSKKSKRQREDIWRRRSTNRK